ncbi:MAG: alpha/beta fold hydrolase [Thermoleophilia bacterium]|nr:alpha/beta fold hydrolase [Thermoleophilia bacterium]
MSSDDTFATRNDPLLVKTADGCPLPLRLLGPRDDAGAPAVLLLAGGDGSMGWWRALLPALCLDEAERRLFAPLGPSEAFDADLRVAVWDARGGGRAGRGHGVAAPGPAAADALRMARGLFDGPVHLLGHGLGGLAAAMAALEAPELVASLTLVSPPLVLDDAAVGDLALSGPGSVSRALAPGWAGHHEDVAAALLAEAGLSAAWADRLGAQGSPAGGAAIQELDLERRLTALGRPLLLIHGLVDAMVPPDTIRAFARRAGDKVRLVELDGGHLLPVECAPEVAAAVVEHVAAVGRY